MGRIGITELLVILGIALLIFGPKSLPKLGETLGKALGNFRKGVNEDSRNDGENKEEDSTNDR